MYRSSQTLIIRKVVITFYSMGRKLQHKDMNTGNAIVFVTVHVLKILQDIYLFSASTKISRFESYQLQPKLSFL